MRVAYRLQPILLPVLQRPVVKTAAHAQTLTLFIKRHQWRDQHIQFGKRQNVAHVEFGFCDFQTIHHQLAVRMIVQKQQIAFAERVQHRQVYLLPGAPELLYQRLGVQLAVKRQKQGNRARHHDRGIRHHTGGGLLGKMRLLFWG